MSQGTKKPLANALAIAEEVKAKLSPHCERIELAGSIRRRREMVGDIELVAIPTRMKDLLGHPVPKAKTALDLFFEAASFKPDKDGERYKAFSYRGWHVDLYTPEPERWGLRLLVSTGSRAFNIWAVEALRARGYRMVGGQVLDGLNRIVPLPSEALVFELLGLPYIRPEDRHDGVWYGIVRAPTGLAGSVAESPAAE